MTDIKTKALHGNIRKYVKSLKRQDWERDRPSLYSGRDWKHTIPLDTGAIFIYKEHLSDATFRLVVWDGTYWNDGQYVTHGYVIQPNRSWLHRLPFERYPEVADKFEELARRLS